MSHIDTNGWPPAPEGPAHQVTVPGVELAGSRTYLAQGCNACHSIQGTGGTLAPDLTHVGNRRSQTWMLQELNNPSSHKADSIMPSFAQLSESDKQQLSDYLVSLK